MTQIYTVYIRQFFVLLVLWERVIGHRCAWTVRAKVNTSIVIGASNFSFLGTVIPTLASDDAQNTTSRSHGPRALLMAPAQQQERIFAESTGVVSAKYPLKIKSELFSLL